MVAGFTSVAGAVARHPAATMKPTFDIAYEGPLSGGNAQLGLNMEFSVKYAINMANSGMSQFGKLPFTLTRSSLRTTRARPRCHRPTPRSSSPTHLSSA